MSPNPVSPGAAVAWQIFLSSTVRDLEGYRRSIKDALDEAEMVVSLSEDWPAGYDDIVEKCRARVQSAHGFVLLIGHWYGSIPAGHQKSITHLEFEWAFNRWKETPFRPMAVFRPEDLSPADQELRSAADPLIQQGYPSKSQHDARLEAFRAEVEGSWRGVKRFKTLEQLQRYALISCLLWQGKTPQAAARGETKHATFRRVPSDDELGRLGREKHLLAARDILVEVGAQKEVPAVCLLVSGDEDAGQGTFLQALLRSKAFKSPRPPEPGRPMHDHYDVAILVQWTARVLGVGGGAEIASPEALAERVAAELKLQPLWLALDQVGRLNGGIPAFRDSFWKPLYSRLKELRAAQAIPHRLVVVAAEYSGDPAAWQASVCGPDFDAEPADYSKLLLLPPLGGFKRKDVLAWFEDLEVPEERRAGLTDSVLQDGQGKIDGTPLRVFDRLRRQALWPEDQNDD